MSQCNSETVVDLPSLSAYEIVEFEPTYFLYQEIRGPFMKTAPKVWTDVHGILGAGGWHAKLAEQKKVMAGLSMCDNTKEGDEKFVYQAGLLLHSPLETEIEGLATRTVPAGRFAKFLLTGPYQQLAQAYPTATGRVVADGHSLRETEFFMEQYLNTYGTVPEEELKTEIWVPLN